MSIEKDKMLSGQWFDPSAEDLIIERTLTRTRLQKHNLTIASDFSGRDGQIRQILGQAGENLHIVQPFWCDYGYNIEIGDNFYANFGLTILDAAKVTIGNNVKIGPNCNIYTTTHPKDIERRNQGLEQGLPITIGDNVWIGGNVTILPGVSIGQNAIIGAGSVVVSNVPSNTTCVGVPARSISSSYEDIWAIVYHVSKYLLENPDRKLGTAMLQRRYSIGYGKASHVIDTMVENKIAKQDPKTHTYSLAIKSIEQIKIPEGVDLDPEKINANERPDSEDFAADAAREALKTNQTEITTNWLQRHFKIGFGRAASIIEDMQERGMLAEQKDSKGPRKMKLKSEEELDELLKNEK